MKQSLVIVDPILINKDMSSRICCQQHRYFWLKFLRYYILKLNFVHFKCIDITFYIYFG